MPLGNKKYVLHQKIKSIDFGFHFLNLWFMDWPYVVKMYDALKVSSIYKMDVTNHSSIRT
jgi:hypothetical protein